MNNRINKIGLVAVCLFTLGTGIIVLPKFNSSTIVNAQDTTRKSKTDMNFFQIKKGNYTSLLGKWKLVGHAYNSYDGKGICWHKIDKSNTSKLTITKKKIQLNKYATFHRKTMKVKGENLKRKLKFKMRKGSLSGISDSAILWEIDFYPKKVPLMNKVKDKYTNSINTKKDRIYIFCSNMGSTMVFQRK